jgi:hypothetical protein
MKSVIVLGFLLALVSTVVSGAQAYHRFWANCNYATAQPNLNLTRDGAQTYAYTAAYDGYHWGGGCWNNNDVDEAYGDPPGDVSTHGEGPDCSGLTFKTWKEAQSAGDGGKYYWNPLRNVHGPYTAAMFRDGYGAPNGTVYKPYAGVMDAFASDWHIGMVFFRSLYGGDQVIEAKCEVCGTNIFYETYRTQSAYGGVRRIGWTG